MICHLILLTLKEGFEPDAPNVQEALEASRGLAKLIPEAGNWNMHRGLGGREGAADFVGHGRFQGPAELVRFLKHPKHAHVAVLWDRISTGVVADIQIAPGDLVEVFNPPALLI